MDGGSFLEWAQMCTMGVTGSLLFFRLLTRICARFEVGITTVLAKNFTGRYLLESPKQEFGSPLGDYDRWEQA